MSKSDEWGGRGKERAPDNIIPSRANCGKFNKQATKEPLRIQRPITQVDEKMVKALAEKSVLYGDEVINMQRDHPAADVKEGTEPPLAFGGAGLEIVSIDELVRSVKGVDVAQTKVWKTLRLRGGTLTVGDGNIVRAYENTWFDGGMFVSFDNINAAYTFLSYLEGKPRACLSLDCSACGECVLTRLHYEGNQTRIAFFLSSGTFDARKVTLENVVAPVKPEFRDNIRMIFHEPQVINPVPKPAPPPEPVVEWTAEATQQKWAPLMRNTKWRWFNKKQHPLMDLLTPASRILTEFPQELGNYAVTITEVAVAAPVGSSTSVSRQFVVEPGEEYNHDVALSRTHWRQDCIQDHLHPGFTVERGGFTSHVFYSPITNRAVADRVVSVTTGFAGDVVNAVGKAVTKVVGVHMSRIDTSTQFVTTMYYGTCKYERVLASKTMGGYSLQGWDMATLKKQTLTITGVGLGFDCLRFEESVSINCDLANRILGTIASWSTPPAEMQSIIEGYCMSYQGEYSNAVHDSNQYGTVLMNTAQFVLANYNDHYFVRGPGSMLAARF